MLKIIYNLSCILRLLEAGKGFMELPAYTELSNFSIRRNGAKSTADITVSLFLSGFSDPVDTINSIYKFVAGTNDRCEFLLINNDKESYKYDKLLDSFPMMRVILPRVRISASEALEIAVKESLSGNVLILDGDFTLNSFDLNVIRMYLSESSFGILLPLIVDGNDKIVPGIVKGGMSGGFISTISTDIVGTAVSSLYSKYFCFIINRDAFISRNIELNRYDDIRFTLLELGYKLWKEGYIITQVRNFKVRYTGESVPDVFQDFRSKDYLEFNFLNISDRALLKGRPLKILILMIGSILLIRWRSAAFLANLIMKSRKIILDILSKPVEDSAIFSIINKDTK